MHLGVRETVSLRERVCVSRVRNSARTYSLLPSLPPDETILSYKQSLHAAARRSR